MPFIRAQFIACMHSLLLGGALLLAGHLNAARPAFVERPLEPSYSAKLVAVDSLPSADIVFLGGGLRDGLQAGMVCEVSRGQQLSGQIIIIEVSSTQSAALITTLQQHSTLQAGDIARVQTIKNG
jgi:hypothetical protein